MAQKIQVTLGLYISKSFAEISALTPQLEEVAFKRWYTPRMNIHLGIREFLETLLNDENEESYEVNKIYIASQYLEKLFEFKLGGSVAQLVTRGFEQWPYLKQTSISNAWKNYDRAPTLSIKNHWIPVSERVSSDGHLERELSDGELDSTYDYIKAHEIKRICIHFLHSHKNNHNSNKAAQFFTNKGYDVFCPSDLFINEIDESAVFRQNTFNASMTGTWEEMVLEVKKAFEEKTITSPIEYLHGIGPQEENKNLRWNSLLGFALAQQKVISKSAQTECDVLYLGLEKFDLIHSASSTHKSITPWGDVATKGPDIHHLKIQPDSLIFVNRFKELDFSSECYGFEPGPMTLGRGLNPLCFDLFHEQFSSEDEIEGISELLSGAGKQRFINQLLTLSKSSRDQKNTDSDTIISDLKSLCAHQIINEVLWKAKSKKIVVTGYFSELLKEDLLEAAKSVFHLQIKFNDISDSDVVAHWGVER